MEQDPQQNQVVTPASAPTPAPELAQATSTETSKSETSSNRTLFGVCAYLGPLVILSYALGKDDPFVKFHVKQGAVLFVIEIVIMLLGNMMYYSMPFLWQLISLINFACLILSIIGIVNVVQHKEKELPLIGQFSKHIPI